MKTLSEVIRARLVAVIQGGSQRRDAITVVKMLHPDFLHHPNLFPGSGQHVATVSRRQRGKISAGAVDINIFPPVVGPLKLFIPVFIFFA